MANFSPIERLVASCLSATPGIKRIIKNTYVRINALVFARKKGGKILDPRIPAIVSVIPDEQESFYGYYDKSPVNEVGVISHIPTISTKRAPRGTALLKIAVTSLDDGLTRVVGETFCYNWQQGARSQWLDDDLLIYNVVNSNGYSAVVKSMSTGKTVREYGMAVQDAYRTEYFLSLNYGRLMSVAPDYGYRNFSYDQVRYRELDNDGIWKVDIQSGESELLFSFSDILSQDFKKKVDDYYHTVNHIMISPDGRSFIFIHRYYKGQRKYHRLMYSDFETLKVLLDDEIVSHMSWLNDDVLIGYLSVNSVLGYYQIDLRSGIITIVAGMSHLNMGDGHPSVYRDWVVFDSYPDKGRMQQLSLYNLKTKDIYPLLRLYSSVDYMGECRCDLHPRFSPDGSKIFFDSVFSGFRKHCYIDVTKIVK